MYKNYVHNRQVKKHEKQHHEPTTSPERGSISLPVVEVHSLVFPKREKLSGFLFLLTCYLLIY